MSEPLHLDLDALDEAAAQLWVTVGELDRHDLELRRVLGAVELISDAPRLVGEVANELGQLAAILRKRADLARHHSLLVPGALDDRRLWRSLFNGVGARPLVAGDTALQLVLDRFDLLDRDADGRLDARELFAACEAPSHIAEAAAWLLARPVGDRATSRREIEAALRRNSLDRIEAARCVALTHDDLLTMVGSGAFEHDPVAAEQLLRLLPISDARHPGLPVGRVDDARVLALFRAATARDDSLRHRVEMVVRLPETTSGTRNRLITGAYAETALALDALFNDGRRIDQTGHAGATWVMHGAPASDSVGLTITGETNWFGFSAPRSIRQAFADGNQVIAANVLGPYVALIDAFPTGNVDEATVRQFLDTNFDPGDDLLRTAFAYQLAVAASRDPVERQRRQIASNLLVAVHEQVLVDPWLKAESAGLLLRVGASIGSLIVDKAGIDDELRNYSEITTDEAFVVFDVDGDDDPSFPVAEPVPGGPVANNLILHLSPFGALDPANFSIADAGWGDLGLAPIGSADPSVSLDYRAWWNERPHVAVDDWAVFADRMTYIVDLMRLHHTDPLLPATAANLAARPVVPADRARRSERRLQHGDPPADDEHGP